MTAGLELFSLVLRFTNIPNNNIFTIKIFDLYQGKRLQGPGKSI
jgi:hypothetical protein